VDAGAALGAGQLRGANGARFAERAKGGTRQARPGDREASIVVFGTNPRDTRESGALARLGVSRRGGTFLKAVALMGAVSVNRDRPDPDRHQRDCCKSYTRHRAGGLAPADYAGQSCTRRTLV
jgi:hypothetical protein